MKQIKFKPDAICCETCGKYFDPSSLKEVFQHTHSGIVLKNDIKGKKK